MQITKEVFELFLPKGIFEWFEIKSTKQDKDDVYIILEEKDIPPATDKKIIARKFHDITITDFPLKGKRTLLPFRRRYWRLEGQKQYKDHLSGFHAWKHKTTRLSSLAV